MELTPNENKNKSNLCSPWKKGQSGNPQGRPPTKRIKENIEYVIGKKKLKQFYNLSNSEVDFWEKAILTMSVSELKILSGGKQKGEMDAKIANEVPVYAVNLTRAILMDMASGKTNTIDRLRERQFGKAIQKIELTGKDGIDLMPARVLSKAEAKELLESLNNEF